MMWYIIYVHIIRRNLHPVLEVWNYLHNEEEAHVMHNLLVSTTYMMWYVTYVHTIMAHSEVNSMENNNHNDTIVNRNSE